MKKTVYLETSIASYLAARPSRDVRAAAWQELTTQWWEQVRPRYEVFVAGYRCPEICTPLELLAEEVDDVQG